MIARLAQNLDVARQVVTVFAERNDVIGRQQNFWFCAPALLALVVSVMKRVQPDRIGQSAFCADSFCPIVDTLYESVRIFLAFISSHSVLHFWRRN